ncbi:MAG: hypothetical protein PHO32_03465 [Candidatus Cloacimonetes bacterium]|nr:hypothetical protein [Candidatus Cloacimonadota bacterium]
MKISLLNTEKKQRKAEGFYTKSKRVKEKRGKRGIMKIGLFVVKMENIAEISFSKTQRKSRDKQRKAEVYVTKRKTEDV